jgi:predicted DCC family thiol-disulfide oxidoreductase YuxK
MARAAGTGPPRRVYDDQCGFCTWSVELALRHGEFEAVGFSELAPDERARLPETYEGCMHLLTRDAAYSCGAAAERVVELTVPATRPLFSLLRRVPGYARLRDGLYRWIGDRRAIWGRYRSASPPASR